MAKTQNIKAAAQAASLPSDCKVCKRKGLPIFLLRYAALPNIELHSDYQKLKTIARCNHLELKNHIYVTRMLRRGYIYAMAQLKEHPSIKIWLAYEVTPAGSLRQFDPYIMPVMPPEELDETRCISNNDDVPGSFINIDEEKYTEAWIAFSDIPWDEQTLSYYEQSDADLQRFSHVVVATFKSDPSSHPQGITIDPSPDGSFFRQIPEFRWSKNDKEEPIDSFSGFYPKGHKLSAYALRIAEMNGQYGCNIGALILEDSMGLASEINHYRQLRMKEKVAYEAKDDVYHKHSISMMIETYRSGLKRAADKMSQAGTVMEWDYKNASADGMPALIPRQLSQKEMAQRTFEALWSPLQARYKEEQRAADEKEYQSEVKNFDNKIELTSQDYAAWLSHVQKDIIWQQEFHSEKVNCSESARTAHQERLMAVACNVLEGGPSDKSTDELWMTLLMAKEDAKQQYLYNVLFNYQQDVVSAATSAEQANTAIKTVATTPLLASDSMSSLEYLHARLVLSINGAFSRNYERLQADYPRIERALQQYSFNMIGKVSVELEIMTTAKQYLGLYEVIEKNDANSVVQKMTAVSTDGTTRLVDKHDTLRHLRLRPSQAELPVDAKLRLYGTPQEIRHVLESLGLGERTAVIAGSGRVRVSGLSGSLLFPEFAVGEAHMNDETYALLKQKVQSGMHTPDEVLTTSGRIPKIPPLLSAISLFFMISSWRDSSEKMKTSLGVEQSEAYFKLLAAGFGAVGNVVEICGFIMHRKNPALGGFLVKGGGALVAVSAIADGVGNLFKSNVSFYKGDVTAGGLYFASSMFLFLGGFLGLSVIGGAPLLGGALFFGPAGWAFILITIGVGLALAGDYARSTVAEIWFDRCYYGKHERNEMAWSKLDRPTLKEAKDAFSLLTLGIQVETDLSFDWNFQYVQPFKLVLRLPGFEPARWDELEGKLIGPGYQCDINFLDENEENCGSYKSQSGFPIPYSKLEPYNPDHKIPKTDVLYNEIEESRHYEFLGGDSMGVLVLTLKIPVDTRRVRSYSLDFRYWLDVSNEKDFSKIEILEHGDKK